MLRVEVCCNVLQCASVCLLQRVAIWCVAVCCSVLQCVAHHIIRYTRVLQCVVVCCSVLQCVAVRYTPHHQIHKCVAVCCSVLHVQIEHLSQSRGTRATLAYMYCGSVLQCVAVWQHVAVSYRSSTWVRNKERLLPSSPICIAIACCCVLQCVTGCPVLLQCLLLIENMSCSAS